MNSLRSLFKRHLLFILGTLGFLSPLHATTWFEGIRDPLTDMANYSPPGEHELVGTKYTLNQIENQTDEQLARLFAPVFFFNRYEEWLPIDPALFVEEAQLTDDSGNVLATRTELASVSDLLAYTSGDKGEVLTVPSGRYAKTSVKNKLSGKDEVDHNVSPSYRYLSNTPVFANVIRDQNQEFVDLVYFIFFAYNGCMVFEFKTSEVSFSDPGTSVNNHEWCHFGRHEGDWEVITVRLRKTSVGDGYHMETVQTYAHGEGTSHYRVANGGMGFWHQSGYERVKIYSALNTHGLYTQEATHKDQTVLAEGVGILLSAVMHNIGMLLPGSDFSWVFINRIKTVDITNLDIKPSTSGNSIGAGKFSNNATANGFTDHGDKVRLDPKAHGNSIILLENWSLTEVFNGRWGEQGVNNSNVQGPTGNVKHFPDDDIIQIAQLAVDRGIVPDDMVEGNGSSSPWTKNKVYYGLNGESQGKKNTKAVAIAYNSNRSEYANWATGNKRSLYVAGSYGSDGELWFGQGKQPNWQDYNVMRRIRTEAGMLHRWHTYMNQGRGFLGVDVIDDLIRLGASLFTSTASPSNTTPGGASLLMSICTWELASCRARCP